VVVHVEAREAFVAHPLHDLLGLELGPLDFLGYGAVWVVWDGVTRIDPGRDVTVDIRGTASGAAFAIAAGAGSVWVADDRANEILRIAPRRARLIARVRVPGRAWGVAAGRENVIVVSVPTGGRLVARTGRACSGA
jgi:hypothetical protein